MDRTLKNAIHKAWEAAHKQGEAFKPDVVICPDIADENEIGPAVKDETPATKKQHHAQVSLQVLGGTDAPTTIEKASEIPSAAGIEKILPQV